IGSSWAGLRLGLAQKLFNFSTLRGSKSATETGAFQGGGGGSEAKRLGQVVMFVNGERERAMEHVAGAERIHGVHGEGRRPPQLLARVEPERALRALGSRQKRWREFRNLLQRLGIVGGAGGGLQRLPQKNQMRGGGEQPLPQRHGATE